jgi:hypothetical protein
MPRKLLLFLLLIAAASLRAETADRCTISIGRHDEKMEFSWGNEPCLGHEHCRQNSSNDISWEKWGGITPADLQHEGAQLDARRRAEAGEMRCTGTVRNGTLEGAYSFTPDPNFARQLEAMGFMDNGLDHMQTYAMLDVTIGWVKGLKQEHVSGMTSENVIAMRALRVDPDFVHGMAAAGYPEVAADKLISMRAVGVSPEKVKAVRDMGFSPSEDELIQMSVFKIDAPFVERMRQRGFKNPTIAQLVQIKIFKLDE